MNRICKLIHTDLKPENVVISLSKRELEEIQMKGVLKTTKMYHQKEEQIARAVAGAHDEIILSSRVPDDEVKKTHEKVTNQSNSEFGMSKDWSEMTAKDKKRFRKRKRKQIKKYITQGRLPENYDDLPQDEKDRLYNEIRDKVRQENLQRDGLNSSKVEEQKNEEEKEEPQENKEIEIDTKDIELCESTQMTTNTELSKQQENKEDKKEDKKKENKPSAQKKKPKSFRHSSVPGNKHFEEYDEEDLQEIEKLKQLMAEGMDDTPSKPNIPKLNTKLINQAERANEKVTKRGPKIDENVNLAIVDMGNGCWTHHHFTSQIQTRQYRSPETIIGVPYGASADIWSLACMIFELLTGDFLFEPRKGYYYDKDDDHLAQMIELLGPMPKNFALSGKNSKRFFDSTGHLRRIRGLNYWPLHRVLIEKYRFEPKEAEGLADFLHNMLIWYPEKRATAQEMLDHPWLKMQRNDTYRMEEEKYSKMMEEIKQREETEKKKKELEVILREGSMDPDTLSKKIRSENMSELAESNFEK